jgi:hypothetical protein
LNGTAWRGIGLLSDLMMGDDDEHLTGRTGQKGKPMALFAVVFKVMDEQHGVWVPTETVFKRGRQKRVMTDGWEGSWSIG